MGTRFDPANKGTTCVLSNGNLTVSGDDGTASYEIARFLHAFGSATLYYWEVRCDAKSGFNQAVIGVCAPGYDLNGFVGNNGFSAGVAVEDGNFYQSGANQGNPGTPTPWAVGDRVCMAFNMSTGRLWAKINAGLWNGGATGDPAGGVLGYATGFTTGTRYGGVTASANTDIYTLYTQASEWLYTPPSGAVPIGGLAIPPARPLVAPFLMR